MVASVCVYVYKGAYYAAGDLFRERNLEAFY